MTIHHQCAAADTALFRRVMGRFTTGVTVIAAEVDGLIRGMTANAFMSGSLTPPLCILSVAKRARLHDSLMRAGRFGVSMLAQGQEAVSAHFAGQSADHVAIEFESVASVPLLKNASAAIAAKIEASHGCGDHTLFIGRIIHMQDNDRAPLVYQSGRYGAFVSNQTPESTIEFW